MIAGVPYHSQFASRELVNLFLAEPDSTSSDPRWSESGWSTPQDYATWAWRACGIACLRSILSAHGHTASTAVLARDLLKAGAYTSQASNESVGLIYQPFARYLHTRWDLPAHAVTNVTITDLQQHLTIPGRVVIASVTPSIRDMPIDPPPSPRPRPRPGGHLVLTFNADHEQVWFHNPSGYWPHRQEGVTLPTMTFAQAFAGRGITVDLPAPGPGRRKP